MSNHAFKIWLKNTNPNLDDDAPTQKDSNQDLEKN